MKSAFIDRLTTGTAYRANGRRVNARCPCSGESAARPCEVTAHREDADTALSAAADCENPSLGGCHSVVELRVPGCDGCRADVICPQETPGASEAHFACAGYARRAAKGERVSTESQFGTAHDSESSIGYTTSRDREHA